VEGGIKGRGTEKHSQEVKGESLLLTKKGSCAGKAQIIVRIFVFMADRKGSFLKWRSGRQRNFGGKERFIT